MAHATIPNSFSSFCNVTASPTKPAAQTIPGLMEFLENGQSCQAVDGQNWKRMETMDFRSI